MFFMAMAVFSGCTDHDHRAVVPEPPVAEELDRGHVRLIEKAWPDSVAHLTMNNPWSPQDVEALGISRSDVRWEGEPCCDDPAYEEGQIVPHTTRLTEYRKIRRQCAEDFREIDSKGDRLCYPELTQVKAISREVVGPIDGSIAGSCRVFGGITLFEIRYGRYCGGGYPVGGTWLDNRGFKGHPIDSVDYCCRLHDATAWNLSRSVLNHKNVCGFVMCVAQASEFPLGISNEEFTETLQARQCIWNRATTLITSCRVDPEFQIAPRPVLARLPSPPQTRLDRKTGQAVQIP